jgi:SAM-dependent methyltransferase
MLIAGCPDYYLGHPGRVDYVTCLDCGLVQQDTLPQDVRQYYEAYPVHEVRSRPYAAVARLLTRDVYLDPDCPAGSVILDYGCGSGAYLESLQGRGFELAGLEPDAAHAARVSERLGIPVYSEPDKLDADLSGRVDLLTMHFVLEHVTDLHGTFASVGSLLRPGGVCVMVVPNIASWESRLFGRKWHGLDPPRHISFPGAAVIAALARRHGMRLTHTRSVAFPNGVAGSLPVCLLGRFSYGLFLASVPVGYAVSRLAPTGCAGFRLVRSRD